MAYLNENYLKLQAGYLFPEIARRVRQFSEEDPEAAKRLIRCGIGDVTEPLPRSAIEAMKAAAEELGQRETFRGYGPEQGYEFLRSKIAQFDYRDRGIEITEDEIFLSDGSKCDCGHILDILGEQNKIAITDPVYPVYVDTNVMAGHTGAARKDGSYEGIVYLPCTAENNFVPAPEQAFSQLLFDFFSIDLAFFDPSPAFFQDPQDRLIGEAPQQKRDDGKADHLREKHLRVPAKCLARLLDRVREAWSRGQ